MKEFTVREDTTLKTFTDNFYAQASFCFRTLLKAREIRVNGARVSADMPLKQGDIVRYFLTPKQESRAAFSVVYEDGNVIVADKESGVNSEAVFSRSASGERRILSIGWTAIPRDCLSLRRTPRRRGSFSPPSATAAWKRFILRASSVVPRKNTPYARRT